MDEEKSCLWQNKNGRRKIMFVTTNVHKIINLRAISTISVIFVSASNVLL